MHDWAFHGLILAFRAFLLDPLADSTLSAQHDIVNKAKQSIASMLNKRKKKYSLKSILLFRKILSVNRMERFWGVTRARYSRTWSTICSINFGSCLVRSSIAARARSSVSFEMSCSNVDRDTSYSLIIVVRSATERDAKFGERSFLEFSMIHVLYKYFCIYFFWRPGTADLTWDWKKSARNSTPSWGFASNSASKQS